MSISFLRISPKPFPPPFAIYIHHTYLLAARMAAKDPIVPVCHMKSVGAAVADGGPTFRFGHVPGPAPMMRRNSDIVGLSGLGKCCSSKQVEARRRNWASVLAAYSSSSSSHPDSPIITTLSSHYHHSSIGSQYLMAATTSIHFLPLVPKLLSLVVNTPKTRRAS